MKISTVLIASKLFAAFASAAPASTAPLSALDTRAFQVGVTFYGADAGTSFFQNFPANEGPVKISKFLKSSHPSISSLNPVYKIKLTPFVTFEITPSPLHKSLLCGEWRFDADELTKIANPLSVSHIAFSGGAVCFFTGIDGSSVVLEYQQIREADVSPPQAQVSGYCIQWSMIVGKHPPPRTKAQVSFGGNGCLLAISMAEDR